MAAIAKEPLTCGGTDRGQYSHHIMIRDRQTYTLTRGSTYCIVRRFNTEAVSWPWNTISSGNNVYARIWDRDDLDQQERDR